MAVTLDGHVAHPEQAWNFGSKEDRRRMDRLREWADCLIVSRKTLEHDNMDLSVRTKPHAKRHPRPVIIAQNERPFKPGLNVLKHAERGGEVWLASSAARDISLKALWGELGEDWELRRFDSVIEIIDSLKTRGFKKFLLEGGPTLNGVFFSAGLVDEFYLTLLPILWGGTTTDRAVITPSPIPMERFRLVSAEKRKNEMFFRYIRRKKVHQ